MIYFTLKLLSIYNRIVKITSKVIDVIDAVLVTHWILDSIDVFLLMADMLQVRSYDLYIVILNSIFVLILAPTQPPYGQGPRGTYYINSQTFDGRGGSPTNVILDGNQPEQRIPVQLLVCLP